MGAAELRRNFEVGQEYVDRLVRACTAFRSSDELEAALQRGYCPTLYQNTRRNRILTRMLVLAGFPVFRGGGVGLVKLPGKA